MDYGPGFFGALLRIWKDLAWPVKALAFCLALASAALLARIGKFGEEVQTAARRAYPHCVASLDDCSLYAPIEIAVSRRACGLGEAREIADGALISIRDEITLSVTAQPRAWFSVFGRDASSLYAVAPRERVGMAPDALLEYGLVEGGTAWRKPLNLDGASDWETLVFVSTAVKEWRLTAAEALAALRDAPGAQARSILPRGEELAAPGVLIRSFSLHIAPWHQDPCG